MAVAAGDVRSLVPLLRRADKVGRPCMFVRQDSVHMMEVCFENAARSLQRTVSVWKQSNLCLRAIPSLASGDSEKKKQQ
ncbi:Uncharacterized protein DAT39_007778, partial [Clarias magur]